MSLDLAVLQSVAEQFGVSDERSWGRPAAIFIASRLAGEETETCNPSTSSDTGSSSRKGDEPARRGAEPPQW